jgi:hypothetical protein
MDFLIIDIVLGGLLFGIVSYLSSRYGKKNPYYYKILAFLWAAPFFFFYFIVIASRDGKKPIYDFSQHSALGSMLTVIISVLTMLIINYSTFSILSFTLIFPVVFTILYFYFDIFKLI